MTALRRLRTPSRALTCGYLNSRSPASTKGRRSRSGRRPQGLVVAVQYVGTVAGLFIHESITDCGVCWPLAMFSPYVDQR